MELKATLRNSFLTATQRMRAENVLEDFLIDHFGTAESAFKCKKHFDATNKQPNHPWHIAVVKAIGIASRDLKPSERLNFKPVLTFINE